MRVVLSHRFLFTRVSSRLVSSSDAYASVRASHGSTQAFANVPAPRSLLASSPGAGESSGSRLLGYDGNGGYLSVRGTSSTSTAAGTSLRTSGALSTRNHFAPAVASSSSSSPISALFASSVGVGLGGGVGLGLGLASGAGGSRSGSGFGLGAASSSLFSSGSHVRGSPVPFNAGANTFSVHNALRRSIADLTSAYKLDRNNNAAAASAVCRARAVPSSAYSLIFACVATRRLFRFIRFLVLVLVLVLRCSLFHLRM